MQAKGVGPLTRRRLARTLVLLGLILSISGALILNGWTILGLGLALPGAGFWPSVLDDGGLTCLGAPAWITYLGAALLSHLLFAFAILFWFGAGNLIAPPLVWAGSALIAALTAPSLVHEAPTVLRILPFCLWGFALLAFAIPRRSTSYAPIPACARPFADSISDDLAKRCRFALDRALQPVDQFGGFQFVDQFQTTATRYQIAQTGYALALLNAHLPAFRGYLHQAQRNLILKQTDHRIWSYWRLENIWGNLNTNPDPVARDNIMYTGFLAAQIALFRAVTGDRQFSNPGALQLDHPSGRRFLYDQQALITALHNGWNASPFHLMPCEPNWIYPLCNAIGGAAALSETPKAWGERAPSFRHALETEFRARSGAIVPFRSAHLGLAAPPIGGAVVDAYPVLFWNVLFPDLAAELWGRARDRAVQNGTLHTARFWKVDTGDYRFSRAASLAGFAAAAAEMGDTEARDLALERLDTECPADGPGWHRPRASVFAHMTELMARLNPGDGMAGLFKAEAATDGPVLETLDYTNVTVLSARADNGALNLILSGTGPTLLPLAGFPPNTRLSWNKGEATTDLEGRAEITVDLHPNLALRIAPAP